MADTPENNVTQLPIPKLGREAKPRPFKWRAAAIWLDRVCARVKEEDGGIVREAFERAVTRVLMEELDPEENPELHSFASDAILDLTPNQAIEICKEALEAKEEK